MSIFDLIADITQWFIHVLFNKNNKDEEVTNSFCIYHLPAANQMHRQVNFQWHPNFYIVSGSDHQMRTLSLQIQYSWERLETAHSKIFFISLFSIRSLKSQKRRYRRFSDRALYLLWRHDNDYKRNNTPT